MVAVAQGGRVEEEGGTCEISLVEVVDDGSTGVDDHLWEVGTRLLLFAAHTDTVVVVHNQAGLGGGVEEEFLHHKVVAITTTDGKAGHREACVLQFSRRIFGVLDSSTLECGTQQP